MKNKRTGLKEAINQLKPFISPYKWGFIMALIMILLANIAVGIIPTIEGMITSILVSDANDIINQVAGAKVDFNTIYMTILILIIIYIIKMICQAIAVFCITNSIQSAMKDLRSTLQNKIRYLPVKYFDTNQIGDVLSKITNDVDTISNALQQTLTQIISGVLTVTFSIIMIARINLIMTGIVLVLIPSALLIINFIVKRSQQRFKAQQNAIGKLNGAITEMYSGYNEILLYNKQDDAIKKFKEINDELCENAFKAQFMSSIISPSISLVTYLIIGSIGVVGSIFVIDGTILIGQLQAFIRYIWHISDPVSQISNFSSQIQSAFAAIGRISNILNETEEEVIENPIKLDKVKGNVTFENVCFGYKDNNVIKNLNLEVKSGQTVAIVGPTGAGKTTLINLLLRFYDVNQGSIKIDGVDIRDMNRDDLRSIFGMVLQDTWLFSGTIYDNIHYGRIDARKDEVIDAAKNANVHHFVKTLSDGYDMEINEEANNISQGEKQLLTIARALLKNPQIMILDEATSSVDTRVEKMLQSAMHNVMKDRTSFVIAHRLSTIKSADVILVINNGDIVEQGTHNELLAKKGFYEQLYNAQFASKKLITDK